MKDQNAKKTIKTVLITGIAVVLLANPVLANKQKAVSLKAIQGKSITALHPALQKITSAAYLAAKKEGKAFSVLNVTRVIAPLNGVASISKSCHVPDSRGVVCAVDLHKQYAGKQSDKRDKENAQLINQYMQKAAQDLGFKVEWGGNNARFKDIFHWQLSRKSYAIKTAKHN